MIKRDILLDDVYEMLDGNVFRVPATGEGWEETNDAEKANGILGPSNDPKLERAAAPFKQVLGQPIRWNSHRRRP